MFNARPCVIVSISNIVFPPQTSNKEGSFILKYLFHSNKHFARTIPSALKVEVAHRETEWKSDKGSGAVNDHAFNTAVSDYRIHYDLPLKYFIRRHQERNVIGQ